MTVGPWNGTSRQRGKTTSLVLTGSSLNRNRVSAALFAITGPASVRRGLTATQPDRYGMNAPPGRAVTITALPTPLCRRFPVRASAVEPLLKSEGEKDGYR